MSFTDVRTRKPVTGLELGLWIFLNIIAALPGAQCSLAARPRRIVIRQQSTRTEHVCETDEESKVHRPESLAAAAAAAAAAAGDSVQLTSSFFVIRIVDSTMNKSPLWLPAVDKLPIQK